MEMAVTATRGDGGALLILLLVGRLGVVGDEALVEHSPLGAATMMEERRQPSGRRKCRSVLARSSPPYKGGLHLIQGL